MLFFVPLIFLGCPFRSLCFSSIVVFRLTLSVFFRVTLRVVIRFALSVFLLLALSFSSSINAFISLSNRKKVLESNYQRGCYIPPDFSKSTISKAENIFTIYTTKPNVFVPKILLRESAEILMYVKSSLKFLRLPFFWI